MQTVFLDSLAHNRFSFRLRFRGGARRRFAGRLGAGGAAGALWKGVFREFRSTFSLRRSLDGMNLAQEPILASCALVTT